MTITATATQKAAAAAAVATGDWSDADLLNPDELAAAARHATAQYLDVLDQATAEALAERPAGPGRDHEITNLDDLASGTIGITATAIPYVPTPPIQNWTCADTVGELRKEIPRQIEVRRQKRRGDLEWSDYFAGAGGSSSGIRNVEGAHVRMAVNHWPLAIETHNYNHPDTDHDVANVARTDPSRYPGTDLAWFSPECTHWSVARGDKCDYDLQSEQMTMDVFNEEEETPEAKEARWRSRMLMTDVVRFTRHHGYKGVIVENVPDILKWAAFDRWIGEMHAMGYNHKVIALNSAFANKLGAPAPQLRDRVYVMFWKSCYKRPNFDKWLRTKVWCPSCCEVVDGIYSQKPGKRRALRYGPKAQYTYRCPKLKCRGTVAQPFVLPAAAVIDWTLPAEKIGGRKKPLALKTRTRIQAGLNRYARRPMLTPAGGTWNDEGRPVDLPMRARTTRENEAVVIPANYQHSLIAPMEGRAGVSLRSVNGPMRAQTTRHQDALVIPPLIVPMRNNATAAPADGRPLVTFAAGGMHQALVMRNNTARNNDSGAGLSTPVGEPIRTLTTAGHQSLVQWGGAPERHGVYTYNTGNVHHLARPLTTQTTIEGDALISTTAVDVDDCTLRMLSVEEIQGGMAFDDDYVLLGNAKRDKVRMLGNAVTPPTSRDLAACLMESITGVDMPLYELAA